MVYGRNVRGPFELLKEEWESKENRVMNICQWVNELKQRLEMIRDIVVEREGLAKETMKVQYDKRAKERELRLRYRVAPTLTTLQLKINHMVTTWLLAVISSPTHKHTSVVKCQEV